MHFIRVLFVKDDLLRSSFSLTNFGSLDILGKNTYLYFSIYIAKKRCVATSEVMRLGMPSFGCVFFCIHKRKEEEKIMSALKKCPLCGETIGWIQIDKQKKGFSLGKSVAGGVIFGPLGLIAGTGGKKMVAYHCKACGFEHEYKK